MNIMIKKKKGYNNRKIKLIACMILSFFIYVLSNGEWAIPVFAWIYPFLFLLMLRAGHSRKMYFIVFGIYVTGFIIQFVNVIGMDLRVCMAVAVLLGILKLLPYLCWTKSRMKFQGTLMFAAAMTLAEYAVYLIYPVLGGLSDAYGQYRNLYLLQIVTVTGIYGITFIINWTAAITLWIWDNRYRLTEVKKYVLIYGAVMGTVFLYGISMYQLGDNPEKSVRTAGVTEPVSRLLNEDQDVYAVFYTDTFTDENMANTKHKLALVTDRLFIKSVQEAQAGAKIVFWSELNGAVLKEDEEQLLQKASEVAKKQKIYFIVSLLVKTPYESLKENKAVVFDPQGEIRLEYFKFGRSIGELCQKGDGVMKSFDTDYGRIAPFICSDLAFTSTVLQAGKQQVDLLIVPASDWKEMTQIASKTAIVRGVENGCSIIRHTNQGMSLVSDYRGNILAQSDYFQSDTLTMASQVFTKGRTTLYPYIGNLFVSLCGIYLLGSLLSAARPDMFVPLIIQNILSTFPFFR